MKKILSICIPTYQRKKELEKTITALVPLITQKKEEIEICVSDNGSTDGTYEMLKEYAKKYSNFRIRRNFTNRGYDYNFYKVANMARGEYVWIIGDDDEPQTQNIFKLTEKLEKGEYDLVILNCGPKNLLARIKKYFKKEEYTQKEFLEEYKRYIKVVEYKDPLNGFISSYLYKKRVLLKVLNNKRYFGWIHYAIFVKVLTSLTLNRILVCFEPIILIPYTSNKIILPYEQVEVFIYNRFKALEKIGIKKRYCEEFKKIFYSSYLKQIYLRIIILTIIFREYATEKENIKNYQTIEKIEEQLLKNKELNSYILVLTGRIIIFLNKKEVINKIINKILFSIGFIYKKIARYNQILIKWKEKKILNENQRTKYGG